MSFPFPKNKKKMLSNTTTYRGIARSNIFGKVLDFLILRQNAGVLNSCNLLFGLKQNHSTMQCSFVMNKIIQYYKKQK